jgi:hypothetical protein
MRAKHRSFGAVDTQSGPSPTLRVLGMVLGLLVVSCSDDDPSTRTIDVPPDDAALTCPSAGGYPATLPEPYPADGTQVSAVLGASLNYGAIKLVIPPGALASDTEIKLHSWRPGEDRSGDDPLDNELRYSFEPRNLPLALPATLTIKPFFAVSAGMHPVLAELDDQQRWVDLETHWDAGRGTVSISRLSAFVPRRVKLSTNNCSFQPCGGDLEGEWFHTTACGGPWKRPSSNLSCATSFYRVQPAVGGSLTFAGGSFSSVRYCSKPWSAQIPFACVDSTACASLTSATGKCATNSVCSCEGNLDREFRTRNGTFATDGTVMTLVDESAAAMAFSYCVQGDSLVLEGADGRLFELERSKR